MMDSDFLYLVEAELANARENSNAPIASKNEAYGLLSIELSILLDEIRMPSINHKATLLRRLVEIAAMCYRAVEDLQLLEVAATPEPEAHQWCEEHQGKRFRADDPNQEKLGMAINYVCLHGVEWTITGACFDAIRSGQFPTHCDCQPPWPTAEEVYARRAALPNYKF